MMRICACVSDPGELLSPHLREADLMELRLDLMGSLPESLPPLPFIATFHPSAAVEGGPGAAEAQRWALRMGAAFLDLDEGEELFVEGPSLRIIRSHHDWEGAPQEDGILSILDSLGGDLRKAAFHVGGLRDLASLLRAGRRCVHPHALVGMGPLGQVTRLRPRALGNEFSYASLGSGTAPGQLPVPLLRELGDDGIVTGLIGHPISHSLSPALHQAAFRSTGLRGRYLLLDLPGGDGLELLPELMEGYGIRGLNVTMPHKLAVMPHLDAVDPVAEDAGAVNTILLDGSRLVGHNTDVAGLEASLRSAGLELRGSSALIIGNGGAARAAASLLRREGCSLTVSARDRGRGASFASSQGAEFAPLASLPGRAFDLIVNATPAGRSGEPWDLPLPREALSPGQAVMDMVYEPRETPLLREAARMGSKAIPGSEMLLHQARESFRIWTGRDPDPEEMRRSLG